MSKLGYISGDLVMTNGVSGGTAKDVVYKVAASDPSRISVLDDGTVLKGIVRLRNLEGAKLEDKGYLYYGSCYVYFKDIIPTLEGDMYASLGDYIIKGVNGEFYPCKPSIFAKTYEEVTE